MRDYGTVSPQFWVRGTGKDLRGDLEAQVVALYLMTSPHANMIGVYYCPIDYIAKETGLSIEGATKALARLSEKDYCTYDQSAEMVFVHRFAANQVGEELKIEDRRVKGVANELAKVPPGLCADGFRARYAAPYHLAEPEKAPSKGLQKPLASQKQEQEQKQDQEQKDTSPAKLPTCPYQSIVDLYRELLPELPDVRVMDETRKRGIRERWVWVLTTTKPDGSRRAEDAEGGLAWFRLYFEMTRESDFLMGRTAKTGEHKNWKADIDFLMTTKGLKQVLERTQA